MSVLSVEALSPAETLSKFEERRFHSCFYFTQFCRVEAATYCSIVKLFRLLQSHFEEINSRDTITFRVFSYKFYMKIFI